MPLDISEMTQGIIPKPERKLQTDVADPTPKKIEVSLLTGGSDRPYVFGLTTELLSKWVDLDVIGSDELAFPEFDNRPGLRFLNLRGSQQTNSSFVDKTLRIARYYLRLLAYSASAEPKIFHILWNNKFEYLDRTLLMLYYRLLGKKVVFTAHNVNAAKRDCRDSYLNRLTLKIQYRLADVVFVHTEKMKRELVEEFKVHSSRVVVIPFGINNAVPNTTLTSLEARQRLGIGNREKVVLFFGRITPYKGVEYLIAAFRKVLATDGHYRLVIAGRVDRSEQYWSKIRQDLQPEVESGRVLLKDEYIPDPETEVYFKAADVLVLPYKNIYQSGVLFLSHSFGLPVLAAEVGSLTEEIIEGKTGYSFKPESDSNLALAIHRYFSSELYANLLTERRNIQEFAAKRHSWDTVGRITVQRYADLLGRQSEKSEFSDAPPIDLTTPL